jgi:hypothetical protein
MPTIDQPKLTKLARRSARAFPPVEGMGGFEYVIRMAASADGVASWGSDWKMRDQQLRAFVADEPWVAATVSSLAARNSAYSWSLEGPPRTVARLQDMLQEADYGRGWVHMLNKLSSDLYCQDNGAFLEIIREGQSATSPVIGLAHLDAGRVTRTGNPDVPYIYQDREGGMHRLAWYQCVDLTDFPSPVETHNGAQLCAVSRVLRVAQILRDVNIRKQEKLSGRFAGVLQIVSGIKREAMDNAFAQAQQEADNRGRMRYQPPVILGTVDPTAKVSKETIEIASLPENWSEEEAMKWYIAVLALAFGCEYQDLAPLPGGGLGSSQQSTILHLKARGKGPEHFQKMLEHRLNWYILPSNVTFKFEERDYEAEQIEALVRKTRAEMYQMYSTVGMPSQVIYQIMQDNGDLKPEYLDILAEGDATPDTQAHDDEPLQPTDEQKLPDIETEQPQPGQEQQPPTGQQPQPPVPGAKGKAEDIRQQQVALEAEKRPLEAAYEAEMQRALADMRRAIVARMRSEVTNA